MLKKNNSNIKDKKTGLEPFPDGVWIVENHDTSTKYNLSNDVILDTGATHHIFCDESAFVTLSLFERTMKTASGKNLAAPGTGLVDFRVYNLTRLDLSKIIHIDNV